MATVLETRYFNGGNFQLAYDLLRQDSINNFSVVRLYGILNVTNNSISWTRGTAWLSGRSQGIATKYNRGTYTLIYSDFQISHDQNGYVNWYCDAKLDTTFVTSYIDYHLELPKIDRTAPTVSIGLGSISETTINVKWSANSNIDIIDYQLNGGSWISTAGNPFIITNLKEDTNYTILLRARKTNNHIWGSSNLLEIKTLAGTFAEASINGTTFKKAEMYLVTEKEIVKISKENYRSIGG